jgi:hypothetical protein
MNSPEIKNLYSEFRTASQSKITNEQFGTLLMFYPSLLVVVSDGVVDKEEWVYIKYLAKFMSDSHKEGITDEQRAALVDNYFEDLRFLITNISDWKEKFLTTLACYLSKHPEIKEDILETLYMFSEASEGSSEDELTTINDLKHHLGID